MTIVVCCVEGHGSSWHAVTVVVGTFLGGVCRIDPYCKGQEWLGPLRAVEVGRWERASSRISRWQEGGPLGRRYALAAD